jgi:membrane-associated phospholipid phosphatase
MEFLDQIDWLLFQWINDQSANMLFDHVLPLLRNKYFWIPFYGFLISFFLFNWKKRGLIISFYLLLVFFACDSINSRILKPTFGRIRPCREPERMEIVVQRVHCSGGFSFPSSHAVNHAGLAVFLWLFFRKPKKSWPYLFLFWAFAIGYSQVYVGVHYPMDVIAGFMIGGVIGTGIFALFRNTDKLLFKEALI